MRSFFWTRARRWSKRRNAAVCSWPGLVPREIFGRENCKECDAARSEEQGRHQRECACEPLLLHEQDDANNEGGHRNEAQQAAGIEHQPIAFGVAHGRKSSPAPIATARIKEPQVGPSEVFLPKRACGIVENE